MSSTCFSTVDSFEGGGGIDFMNEGGEQDLVGDL